ncbi:MAG: hypothetical protein ISS61_02920 [Desulfobacteraceae bacterium]|nr:hypothetical protein [Desulfobacteraceae bacterium]
MADPYRLGKTVFRIASLLPIIIFVSSQSHAQSTLSLVSSRPYQEKLATPFSPELASQQFQQFLLGKGIVIDERDFESVGISFVRNIIVEKRKPFFIFGSQIWPRKFYKRLEIFPRLSFLREQKIDRIQATGIFRRAVGTYYTTNILSRSAIPFSRLLSYIDAAVDRMLAIDKLYPVVKKKNKQQWEDDGSLHEEEIEDPKTTGLFRQSASILILRNDGSNDSDWWYIHVYNEVIPAQKYMTKLNRNYAEGLNVKGLPCWGPTGVVEHSSQAEVVVGCPGPKEQWHWLTGKTKVRDKTSQDDREGRWEVEFEVGEEDSKSVHKWEPGAQYETSDERNKELQVQMEALVEWEDDSGKVMPWEPEPWIYVARPPY